MRRSKQGPLDRSDRLDVLLHRGAARRRPALRQLHRQVLHDALTCERGLGTERLIGASGQREHERLVHVGEDGDFGVDEEQVARTVPQHAAQLTAQPAAGGGPFA